MFGASKAICSSNLTSKLLVGDVFPDNSKSTDHLVMMLRYFMGMAKLTIAVSDFVLQ